MARESTETDGARAAVDAMVRSIDATRGRERQFERVFNDSCVPIVLVDNERRYVAANCAARLVFRLNLGELRRHRIDDLTPTPMRNHLHARWDDLMRDGTAAGPYGVAFADGSALRVVYSALANVLPGTHVIAFAPANWPRNELHVAEEGALDAPARSLTPREREVLSLIAAGDGLKEVAEELTIAPATAKSHARNALRKLGARTRAHAIALAIQDGLIELTPADTATEDS